MCRKLVYLFSFLVLAGFTVSSVSAVPIVPPLYNQDVGAPGAAGSAELTGPGTFRVSGNGDDIWGTGDNFHFVYKEHTGDCDIFARVVDIGTGSNNWAKSGVMVREELTGGSKHVMMVITAGDGQGHACQGRLTTGGGSVGSHGQAPQLAAPYWVRLTRVGDTFTGYYSPDGVNWTQQPNGTGDDGMTVPVDVVMTDPVYIGLCVTSHANNELRTTIFDGVGGDIPVPSWPWAYDPVPADGSFHDGTIIVLGWKAGEGATSHDIYYHTDKNLVDTMHASAFRKNTTATSELVFGLVKGTIYYWKIVEQPTGAIGDTWQFSVVPNEAWNPTPADGAEFIYKNVELRWYPGSGALIHAIYFGTDANDVNDRVFGQHDNVQMQPDANWAPEGDGMLTLEDGTTHFWRIDESTDGIVWYKGPVWEFTTMPEGRGTITQDLWFNMPGVDIETTLYLDPNFPDNPHQSSEVTEFSSPIEFADNYGGRIHGWVYPKGTGDYTFWLCTDDDGRLHLSDGEDPSGMTQIAFIDGWEAPGNFDARASQQSAPVHLVEGERYYIAGDWKEGGGGDHCQVAWQGPGVPVREIIPGAYLSPFKPYWARSPYPPHQSTDWSELDLNLAWLAGMFTQGFNGHELYFSEDDNKVLTRDPGIKITRTDPCYPLPFTLALGTRYYWAVDEVNSLGPPPGEWSGPLWWFETSSCFMADDMEDYNDRAEIRQVWEDGYANVIWGPPPTYRPLVRGGSSGSNLSVSTAVGGPVYAGTQSMVLYYDNDGNTHVPGSPAWYYNAPFFSEVEADTTGPNSLDIGQNWNTPGIRAIALMYQGHPISDGSSSQSGGEYRLNGRGNDIWGTFDEFHYLFIPFSGTGSIVARVMSVENTNPWAKAGVMIREDLTPQSRHAFVCVTPGQGAAFQRRRDPGGTSFTTTQGGPTAPHWVRLDRGFGGVFTAWHSTDGINWTDVNDGGTGDSWDTISMTDPVYVGLALTSHNVAELCTADFNNVSPSVASGRALNIGNNDPETLYVAVEDAFAGVSVVEHNDVNAAAAVGPGPGPSWQEWNIDLSLFSGVNFNFITKVYIGLGDRSNPQQGGHGIIHVDDLRICPPRCVAAFGPSADLTGDCLVDNDDVEVMAGDWLMGDSTTYAQPVSPSDPNLTGRWQFEGNLLDSGPHGYHATDPCGLGVAYAGGQIGQALQLNGTNQHVVVGSVGIDANDPRTIAGWAKANVPAASIANWTNIFGFTSFNATADESFDIQRRGGEDFYCLHVYGWEANMMALDLEWHHLAGTYDGSTLRWYGDGASYGQDSSRMLTTVDHVQMGKRGHPQADNGHWPGRVDEVRIYSRELVHEEIMDLAGVPSVYSPLVSPANLHDDEPNNFKKVNFRDYAIMSDQWLEKKWWP